MFFGLPIYARGEKNIFHKIRRQNVLWFLLKHKAVLSVKPTRYLAGSKPWGEWMKYNCKYTVYGPPGCSLPMPATLCFESGILPCFILCCAIKTYNKIFNKSVSVFLLLYRASHPTVAGSHCYNLYLKKKQKTHIQSEIILHFRNLSLKIINVMLLILREPTSSICIYIYF